MLNRISFKLRVVTFPFVLPNIHFILYQTSAYFVIASMWGGFRKDILWFFKAKKHGTNRFFEVQGHWEVQLPISNCS